MGDKLGQVEIPNWHQLVTDQLAIPGMKESVREITADLSGGELATFGPRLLRRLLPSVYFGTLTFPAESRYHFATENSYIIEWVFALDDLLDACDGFDYAHDFQLLLNRRMGLKLDGELKWDDLPLAHNPHMQLPGLEYSMLTLVENLQPLRYQLASKAQDADGLLIFDRYLTEQIVPAMLTETSWRLRLIPLPTAEQYIEVAYVSICGGLCVSTVNAVLPQPAWNWRAVEFATERMRYATRLINDLATREKDEKEGKPNAVNLRVEKCGSVERAEKEVRGMVNGYNLDLERLCKPFLALTNHADPLYILFHYVYYCLALTEAMYEMGDFLEPETALRSS